MVAAAELEAAAEDALSPAEDALGTETAPLRHATRLAGRLMHATWREDAAAAHDLRAAACAAVGALDGLSLPEPVPMRVPEGFAWYAALPECHLEAAARVARELRPDRALCVGLRSIGTGLSAVAAAALEAWGCAVDRLTLRPRGDPFDRELRLSAPLRAFLRGAVGAGSLVLLVDEGPGLSGSSLGGAARAFEELGADDDQLVLLPAHAPQLERLVSESARARFRRHRCVVEPFERVWLASGRLAAAFGAAALVDASGGLWRRLAYASEGECPAAHPGHERRKYLCLPRRSWKAGEPTLVKFEGLARYGRAARERARRLAAAGFGPQPRRLRHGFLETDWLGGRPLAAGDYGPRVRDRIAAYVAHLARTESGAGPVPFEALAALIRVNSEETIGPDARPLVARLLRSETLVRAGAAIAVDGRMLPHEWVECGGRLLKTDALDHHHDHWFPGCQDVAWDVAGASVEFGLDPSAERDLVAACARALAQDELAQRVPFHRAAYLAFRAGYSAFAASSLGASPDGRRFAALRERYRAALLRTLRAAAADPLPVAG
jgi:hypothetical protein